MFEERGSAPRTFHGGFGMITQEGLKKPGYHALQLLNRLGDEVIFRDEHFIVESQVSPHGVELLLIDLIYPLIIEN